MARPVGSKNKKSKCFALGFLIETLCAQRNFGIRSPHSLRFTLKQRSSTKERIKTHNGFGTVGAMGIAREAASDIMEYVYPKRKSVELTGAEGTDLFQSFNDLVREIAKGDKHGD